MPLELAFIGLRRNQLYIRLREDIKPALSVGFEIMFILRGLRCRNKLLLSAEDSDNVVGILLLAAACNPALCAVDDDFSLILFCLAMSVSPSDMSAVSAVRLSKGVRANVSLTVC